ERDPGGADCGVGQGSRRDTRLCGGEAAGRRGETARYRDPQGTIRWACRLMPAARGTLPVRIGLIGCGTIAYWSHLRTLQQLKDVTLVAAADPDPAARARAASIVRGPVHDQPSDLLLDDIDAVVISAPNLFHAELTVAAARAGKHVYVEKPLAMTASEARTVVDVVAQSKVVATVGFNCRHHTAHQRARALLRSGRIGNVRAVQSAFCELYSPQTMPEWKRRRRSGGGAL